MLQRLFPLGRRSLLWGVHQVIWHPITVLLAWRARYGKPDWRIVVCIIIHDWGYWSAPNMDGAAGERHPEVGARIAGWLFGPVYHDEVLFHSRHYSRTAGRKPSQLCWADKYSILYDPAWWYLLRARLSGEIREYRRNAAAVGAVPLTATDAEWFRWIRAKFRKLAESQDPNSVVYFNASARGEAAAGERG